MTQRDSQMKYVNGKFLKELGSGESCYLHPYFPYRHGLEDLCVKLYMCVYLW